MMKRIYIISLIIISLISSCQNNKSEENNDAIYKSIKKTYTLNADGSMSFQYQHQLKYITHLSFNRLFGESFIVYNPEQQELKINRAETKMADGKIIVSPENAFNEILPHFAAGIPAYNHLREMVVTHTALEPGCLVNFDYEIKSNEGYMPYLSDHITLQEDAPVEHLEIIINIPENVEFNYKLINIEDQVTKTQKDGYIQYKWVFKNLESLSHEDHQPHDPSFAPNLMFSSVNLEEALENLYTKDDLNISDDVKTTIRKRIFGIKRGINIITELQKFVGNEMNDFNIPIDYTAYSIRPLNNVLNSNGGTKLEKAILLNELITYLGFENKLIFTISPKLYDSNVGCIKSIDQYYIQANIDGEDFIISTDPNQNHNLAFNIKDEGILDINAKSVNLPESIYDTESMIQTSGELKINASGDLSGKLAMQVQGTKNPYLHYLKDIVNANDVAVSIFSKDAIKDFKVVEYDQKNSKIEAQIDKKEILRKQADYYFFEIPTSNYGIKGENLHALLDHRKNPFELSTLINESYDFLISIPEGFSFVAPSIHKTLDNNAGSVKIEINFADNAIHLKKSLKINSKEISPMLYSDFKELMNIWNKNSYQELIIKKQ